MDNPPHSAIVTAIKKRKIPTGGKSRRRRAPIRKKGMLRATGLKGDEGVSFAG